MPPLVLPGDRVAIVAPSSPIVRGDLWRGLAWLRERYRLEMRASALSKKGYLAGADDRRAKELADAMRNPHIKAIIVARGGYGLTRILDKLPWDEFARAQKWIAGFSDVTALHVRCASLGIESIHAPNVTGIGRASPSDRLAFMRALERGVARFEWKLDAIRAGNAEGSLAGGNLALLEAMAASGATVVPAGAIVVLEDVTERPYRIDRMLTSLLPQLARASAIVFGEFCDCEPAADGVTALDVIAEFGARVSVPVMCGAPVGHGERNEAFVPGARARLKMGF